MKPVYWYAWKDLEKVNTSSSRNQYFFSPNLTQSECHHGASQTAEEVLNEVNAKYVYGLTATPKRDDGQE
jgi:hypothetical protein